MKFKDSGHKWIGQIPEHWELHFLRGISNSFRKGNGITKEDLNPEGDIACVRYGDLYTKYNYYLTTPECRTIVSKIQNPVYATYGDIYFTCSGEDVEAIGKSVAYLSSVPCLVGGDIIIMKHSQNPKFLGYSLDSYVTQKQKSLGKSKLKVVHISVRDLKNVAIPLPPLEEQEAIAVYLDKKCVEIDELIEIEQQMISDLESYRQSVITEVVTHGLNPNVALRDSGIEWLTSLPEHWEVVRFKSKFSMRKGLTITKADLVEAGVPVINYGQIHSKYNSGTSIVPEILKYIPVTYLKTEPESIVQEGDFIFADTSEDTDGCGNCAYIDRCGDMFAGYHSIIASGGKRNKFFAYLFLTDAWRSQIRSKVTGIKVYSISQSMLANTELIIPPHFEQQEIADYLDAKCAEIDELIKVKQEKIETLKQYRQSLIFEAVTGKTTIA